MVAIDSIRFVRRFESLTMSGVFLFSSMGPGEVRKNVGGPETHIIQGTWRKGQYGSGHAWSRQATPGYSPERETPEKFGDLTCVPGKSPGLEKNRW